MGKIIAIDGNSATVELERNSACDKCGICHMGETNTMHFSADNPIAAQVGKRVLVSMERKSVLKAGFVVYMLPLLALLAGIGLVYGLDGLLSLPGSPDWWAIAVGLVFFGLTFVVIRMTEPARSKNPNYNLTIVKVVDPEEQITDYCGHNDNE